MPFAPCASASTLRFVGEWRLLWKLLRLGWRLANPHRLPLDVSLSVSGYQCRGAIVGRRSLPRSLARSHPQPGPPPPPITSSDFPRRGGKFSATSLARSAGPGRCVVDALDGSLNCETLIIPSRRSRCGSATGGGEGRKRCCM